MTVTPATIRTCRRAFLLSGSIVQAIVASLQYDDLLDFIQAEELFLLYVFAIFWAIAIVISPLMPLFLIAIQFVNPFSRPQWSIPTASSNPLDLRNPLPFVHFGAQLGVANGFGYLVASAWCGWPMFLFAIGCMLAGGGFYLGLLIGIRMAGEKIESPHDRPRLFEV